MAKLIPAAQQRQLDGLMAVGAHAERLFQMGVISHDELEFAKAYVLEQRFSGSLMSTEGYKAATGTGSSRSLMTNAAARPSSAS
jgi:hypothetical protein